MKYAWIVFALVAGWAVVTCSKQKTANVALRDTTNLLVRLITKKDQTILSQAGQLQASQQKAYEYEAKIKQAVKEKNKAIALMSAQERKIAALNQAFKNGYITEQRLRDSLSTMPVFTEDETNRIFLQVVAERDMWRDSTAAVFEQLGRLEYQVSELESDLNSKNRRMAETRTFVQDARAKASSNIIKQIVNGSKIRLLKEIDQKLASPY